MIEFGTVAALISACVSSKCHSEDQAMTTEQQFQKMALGLEVRGLIERNGERNGEIVWPTL